MTGYRKIKLSPMYRRNTTSFPGLLLPIENLYNQYNEKARSAGKEVGRNSEVGTFKMSNLIHGYIEKPGILITTMYRHLRE